MGHKAKHQPGQPLLHTCVHIQLHTIGTYIHLKWDCSYSRHSEQAVHVYTQFALTLFPGLHPQPLSLLPQAMKAECWGLVTWLPQLSYYSELPGCIYTHLNPPAHSSPPPLYFTYCKWSKIEDEKVRLLFGRTNGTNRGLGVSSMECTSLSAVHCWFEQIQHLILKLCWL